MRTNLRQGTHTVALDELTGVPSVPGSLAATLQAPDTDYEFFLERDAFAEDVIET